MAGTLQTVDTDHVPRHIVAAMGVVRDAAGQFLLVRTEKRVWEPPGGQVEVGEDLIAAAQREILEETGCTATVTRLVGVYSNLSRGIVLFMFLCAYTGGDPRPSEETPEVGWFDPDATRRLVTYPPHVDRLRDVFADDLRVVYRSYTMEPYVVVGETWV
jgi:8-oxo-dGTP diphosphatase